MEHLQRLRRQICLKTCHEPDRADGEGFMSVWMIEQVTDIADQMGSKIIKSGYIQ